MKHGYQWVVLWVLNLTRVHVLLDKHVQSTYHTSSGEGTHLVGFIPTYVRDMDSLSLSHRPLIFERMILSFNDTSHSSPSHFRSDIFFRSSWTPTPWWLSHPSYFFFVFTFLNLDLHPSSSNVVHYGHANIEIIWNGGTSNWNSLFWSAHILGNLQYDIIWSYVQLPNSHLNQAW